MSARLRVIQSTEQEPIQHMTGFSHSALTQFMNCEKAYYWTYVKNLERIKLVRSSLDRYLGEVVHHGLYLVYEKKKTIEEILQVVRQMFADKLKEYKDSLLMDSDLEEHFYELEIIAVAMVKAYSVHYKDFIAKTKHVKNEVPFKVPTGTIDGKTIYVKGKIDNILKFNNKYYIHEVKTSKYVNKNYVENIKVQRQTAIYHHYFNKKYKINGKKVSGVFYDVIQKPSIRRKVKSGETREEYLIRLMAYYSDGKRDELFFQEIMEHPKYTEPKLTRDVNKLIRRIYDCKTFDDFSHTTESCYRYTEDNYCQFIPICLEGEPNEQNLRLYKPRIDLKAREKRNGEDSSPNKQIGDAFNRHAVNQGLEDRKNIEYAEKLKKTFSANNKILPKGE